MTPAVRGTRRPSRAAAARRHRPGAAADRRHRPGAAADRRHRPGAAADRRQETARPLATRPSRLVAAVAALAALLASGCQAEAPPPVPEPAPPCAPRTGTGPLPEWARAGFSDDGSGIPHVAGRDGAILAVLFGAPLSAPPLPGRSNKILWVSRLPVTPGDPLRITARRDGTGETADREVAGGPGPSIVDLPAPGCWRLTLTWSGHTDTLDLTYEAGNRRSSLPDRAPKS